MSDFCAVALLVIAVFAGYLSAKWANNWSYWSHRICAASVIALGWMALPHQEQPTEPRLSEQKQMLMDGVAQHYATLLLERKTNGHD